jgi:hypothetical protein
MLAKDKEVLRLVFKENVRLRQVFEKQLSAFSKVHMKPGTIFVLLKRTKYCKTRVLQEELRTLFVGLSFRIK